MAKYEIKTITVQPGQRIGVTVLSVKGQPTGQIIEVRSTAMPEETPNAHLIEVFEHTPEGCAKGCVPVLSCLSVPPDEAKVYEEIMAQRKAEAPVNLFEALEAVFGGDRLFFVDETGVHRVKPKG